MNNERYIDGLDAIPEATARWLRVLLLFSSLLFVVGILLPMITISKFVIVQNSFSIVSGVYQMLKEGQIVLFIVVAGFSIILPLLKINILFRILSNASRGPKIQHYLHLMHEYGRWAMLDVMVVAVLIVTVKLGAIASVEVHLGLFVFGASVLLMMLITNKIVGYTKQANDA